MNHFRKGTRGAYRSGWCWFQEFYQEYRVNTQLAPLPLTVKFVRHLFDSGVFCSVVRTAISAISKYHIIDANMENTIGQHPLVISAMKAFQQLKNAIPGYHGPILILFRYSLRIWNRMRITLKQLSGKIAFLVVFFTLSRYSLTLT